VYFLESNAKLLARTIVAFEMWRGSFVLPERLHLREARTTEVALEVVLCVLVLLSSFPRPKVVETMVALEPRMLRLLVRVTTMLCVEFAVAVATVERGWVFSLFVGQAALVRREFAIAVFAFEHRWVFGLFVGQAAPVGGELAIAVFAFEHGWVFGLLVGQAALVGGEFATAIFAFKEGMLVSGVLFECILGVERLAALFTEVGVFGFPVLVEWAVE
jgi:hypothetical protein